MTNGKGNPSTLLAVFKYLLPYKFRMIVAATALIVTALATLSLGKGIEESSGLSFRDKKFNQRSSVCMSVK